MRRAGEARPEVGAARAGEARLEVGAVRAGESGRRVVARGGDARTLRAPEERCGTPAACGLVAGPAAALGSGVGRGVAMMGAGERAGLGVTARPSAAASGAREPAARLVVGVGCSVGCAAEELGALVDEAVAHEAGVVVAVASVDRRADEPCVVALAQRLDVPLRTFPAPELAEVVVPTPSEVVKGHVGTPSVAEAAALLACGGGGELIVPKRRSPHATCAIAKEL